MWITYGLWRSFLTKNPLCEKLQFSLIPNLKRMLKRWINDDSGQAMAEYGLLIALVIAGLVVVVVAFRDKLSAAFAAATTALGTK